MITGFVFLFTVGGLATLGVISTWMGDRLATPRAVCDSLVGLGGPGVTCSPRDPRFAGSYPAEVVGFFQDVKILSTSPPGGTLSRESQSEISCSLKKSKIESSYSRPSNTLVPI